MTTITDSLNAICTHADLLLETPSKPSSLKQEAEWADVSSSKFKFLGQLIEIIRTSDRSIDIFAKPGRTLRIIQTYLQARDVSYIAPDQTAWNTTNPVNALKIKLFPTGTDPLQDAYHQPSSLILAFDDSFMTQSAPVRQRRVTSSGQLIPICHLVIPNTTEHITRCLYPGLGKAEYQRLLVAAATYVSSDAGNVPVDEIGLSAGRIADSLLDRGDYEYIEMSPLPKLALGGFEEFLNGAAQESSESSGSSSARDSTPAGSKRLLVIIDLRISMKCR